MTSTAGFVLVLLAISGDDIWAFDPNKIGGTGRCELITMESCTPVQYNYTIYPNILGHMSQKEAAEHMEQWKPLTNAKCSEYLRFFVCSIFTPMCDENHKFPVTSCRVVCEEVKRSCSALLAQFKMEWPEVINCSKFPESPKSGVCMAPEALMGRAKITHNGGGQQTSSEDEREKKPKGDVGCPPDMLDSDPFDKEAICLTRCDADLMFSKSHKEFAEVWIACLAVLCLVVTAFTVITYILDTDRFRFPERSIIYMAACYHLLSWAYVARILLQADASGCEQLKSAKHPHLVAGSLNNAKCVLIFMASYYFSMSAGLWWVVLTISWYLSAGKKWGSEAIQAYSSYFHLLAWGLPALLAIAVLVGHKVDANELTKVCSVGNTNAYATLGFVVAPRVLFLLLGGSFVGAGFTSIISVRRSLRRQMIVGDPAITTGVDSNLVAKTAAFQLEDIRRLDKLMVKIGIFSALYLLPTVVVIVTDGYHAYVLYEWTPQTVDCKRQAYKCRRPDWKPKAELYMLNLFMSVIVGVTTGMWVWSGKTCAAWRRRLLCCDMRTNDHKPIVGGTTLPPQHHQQQQQQAIPLIERYPAPTTMGSVEQGTGFVSGGSSSRGRHPYVAAGYRPYAPSSGESDHRL